MADPVETEKLVERIRTIKEALGKELLILTHHYQRKEIIDLGDFRGDSFGLSKKAADDSQGPIHRFLRRAFHGRKRSHPGPTAPNRPNPGLRSRLLDG